MSLQVKIAETREELEQLHYLNWRVYAAELGQDRSAEGEQRLVDRMLDDSVWVIAVDDGEVVGMVGITEPRARFSIEASLPAPLDPDLRAHTIELRRLAVLPERRGQAAFLLLFRFLHRWAAEHGYTSAVISGLESRVTAYARMGFVPFGEPFDKGAARYQPMLLELARGGRAVAA